MKFLRTTVITLALLVMTVLAGGTVQALEVNSDEELLNALRDESTDTITINYYNASLSEFVTVERNLTVNGNGVTLTAKNGVCITMKQGTSLVLKDIVLTGESDFAIKSNGSVRLEGTVEFAGGYGLLLNNGASLDSSASLVSRTGNRIAIAANTNGGEITVSNLNISDTTTAGVLFYIYRGNGTLIFSGTNVLKSSYGSAVVSGSGSSAEQKIIISAHAALTAEAVNAKESDSLGAAFNVRECSLEIKKGASVNAKGSFGGIYCDSLKTEEDCIIVAENAGGSADSGAVVVFGRVSSSPSAAVGNKNTLTLKGYNGLAVYGCSAQIGDGTSITSSVVSGSTVRADGGAVVFGSNITMNSFSDGNGISAKSGFTCGADCDITLASLNSSAKYGIDSGGDITIGDYSVVKCKSAETALSTEGAVILKEYASVDCEKIGVGISAARGVQTGKGSMTYIKDAERYGIYSSGTLLADTVSFGESSDINITSDGTAICSGEAVIFNSGCSAVLTCGSKAPAILINADVTSQGYLRITNSSVTVTSKLDSNSGKAAVSVVGSVIAEDGGKLNAESAGAFGILCRAGDLIVGTNSTVCVQGGCAVFVEDGNVRVSQGGALCAKGTLDSGVRVSKGMMRISEGSTVITEGERFGAEILISGGIWLENPKLFDFRSTAANAVYIESGVFSATNVGAVSAWYSTEGKTNSETWWNADVSGMKAWEINSKLSENKLGYADYTQRSVNGTVRFENGTEVSSEGFEANIGTFSAGTATRISSFKTRPVSPSNYLFIPSGRSFAWQLEVSSVEGEGEKFELVSAPNSGTLTLSEEGLLSYSASESTRGEQVLTYVVTALDGAESLPVEVIINVTRSKPPAAYNHTFDVKANGSLVATVSVTDFDGVISSLSVTQEPEHGKVSLSSDGTVVYTPEGSYVGLDSFKYTAADNDSDRSNEAIVTLLVGMSGETTAKNSTYIAAKNEETAGAFTVKMSKDEVFSHIEITTFPQYGALEVDGLSFVYTPPENFAGTETFGYIAVTENGIVSNEAFVSIITVPSEKPRADALKVDCAAGKAYSGRLSAQDLDGKITTYMIESYPQHGTLEFDASNGKFTYTANASFTGTDGFTFYVYDDEGLRSEVTAVSISVDTYLNMLKASGKLTRLIVIGAISIAAVIVLIVIIVTGTVRKRRRMDREYEEQYGDYYNY